MKGDEGVHAYNSSSSFTPSFDLSLNKTVTEQNHFSGNNDGTLEIVLYCYQLSTNSEGASVCSLSWFVNCTDDPA